MDGGTTITRVFYGYCYEYKHETWPSCYGMGTVEYIQRPSNVFIYRDIVRRRVRVLTDGFVLLPRPSLVTT